jgi:hypothetical protein
MCCEVITICGENKSLLFAVVESVPFVCVCVYWIGRWRDATLWPTSRYPDLELGSAIGSLMHASGIAVGSPRRSRDKSQLATD